jgi:hypothetical protein
LPALQQLRALPPQEDSRRKRKRKQVGAPACPSRRKNGAWLRRKEEQRRCLARL